MLHPYSLSYSSPMALANCSETITRVFWHCCPEHYLNSHCSLCLPNCFLIICVQDWTVSTMNCLKTWPIGVVELFLVLNLTASLSCCVLIFSNDIFLLQPGLLMSYLLLIWKRPNSCWILVHWELNFGIIITLLCISLVLAMPEQHQVYSGHRVQLAALLYLS